MELEGPGFDGRPQSLIEKNDESIINTQEDCLEVDDGLMM